MFNNDEISPNPASQGSPNTKKRSGSSEDPKENVNAVTSGDKEHSSALNEVTDVRQPMK